MQDLVNACENIRIAHNQLAIVIDNAPAHSRAETIVEENPGVQMICLGPYSPALNGIEACWSVLKTAIKRQLSARQAELFEDQSHAHHAMHNPLSKALADCYGLG